MQDIYRPGPEFAFSRGVPPSAATQLIISRYLLPEVRLPLPPRGEWTDAGRPNVLKIWGPPGGQVEYVLEAVLGRCRDETTVHIVELDLADKASLPRTPSDYAAWRKESRPPLGQPWVVVLQHPEALNDKRLAEASGRLRDHLAVLRQRPRTLVISASILEWQRILADFSLRRGQVELRLGGEKIPGSSANMAGLFSGGSHRLAQELSTFFRSDRFDLRELGLILESEVSRWVPDAQVRNQALAASTLPGFNYGDLRVALAAVDARAAKLTDADLLQMRVGFNSFGLLAGWDRESVTNVWHLPVRTVLQLLAALKAPELLQRSHQAAAGYYEALSSARPNTAPAFAAQRAAKARYHQQAATRLADGELISFARFLM